MNADVSKDMSQDTNAAGSAADKDHDHPEGDDIRRQVEYYFSDDNLPTDLYLLKLCGGHENLPVRMGHICSFKKMRGYKPRSSVVAALRKSNVLEVSADGKTIKRRVPLQKKSLLDKDYYEDDEIAYDPRTRRPLVFPIPIHTPKQADDASGLSKNMLKPTGFEKTYIETPQTSEEAAEEEILYDPDKPFVERIEIAIQRFKQRRRMHQMYAHVFDALMRLGGVDSGPRMYQGLSTQEIADMNAEERARALAVHQIPWDRSDTQRWTVDFVGVGKAFLSSWYPAHHGYADDKIKNACQVLRSFYNYILYHKACPEYEEQLFLARDLCDTAELELPKVHAVSSRFPGDFNKSASILFGGAQAGTYIGDKTWAAELRNEGIGWVETGFCDEEAKIRFTTGIAIMGSDKQYEKVTTTGFQVICEECVGLEVVDMQTPDDLTREQYDEQSKAVQHKLESLKPLGKLVCKSRSFEDYTEWDLPLNNSKYPDGRPSKAKEGKQYTFWMEESVLEQCFVGMKLEARVLVLEEDLVILDDVHQVMCSFYTWLLNELWVEKKPKEVKWLKKGMDVQEEGATGTDEGQKTVKVAYDNEFDDDEEEEEE